MKNRVVVTIANQDFTLVANETAEYMNAVAARVDKEIADIGGKFHGSTANVAILAAVNLADALLKAQETADSLRTQLKNFLEESARMKSEVSELRRELSRHKRQNDG